MAARARATLRAVRRITVLGLALGGLAVGVVTAVHGIGNHASGHYAGPTEHAVAGPPLNPGHAIANPWMY